MTEIGKRTADIGIPVAYHNHMNNIGERPEEVDRVLDATDPRYVKVLLDIAHYQQGGGDPVRAVRKFSDRILFLHIKDVQSPLPGNTGDPMRSYRFVELGRGKVDIKAVFAALNEVKFRGWAIVELDAVPDKARTPKESAIIARTYLRTARIHRVNVGVIGAGNISDTHARAAVAAGLRIAGVYGDNQEKARQLADRHGATAFATLDALLAHQPLDLVMIGSPSGRHADHAIAAARTGRHVLVEKPLDISTARIDQLIDEVARAGVTLGVFFQDRLKPEIVEMKRRIDAGDIGTPLLATGEVKWFRPREYYSSSRWRGTWALDGGGALMNQGIHTVDLMLYLLGPVAAVSGADRDAVSHDRGRGHGHGAARVRQRCAGNDRRHHGRISGIAAAIADHRQRRARSLLEGDRLIETTDGTDDAGHGECGVTGGLRCVAPSANHRGLRRRDSPPARAGV